MLSIKKDGLVVAIMNLAILTLIILIVSSFFATEKILIGPILILLGMFCLLPFYLFGIRIRSLRGEIFFGVIDNGILAIFALSGAELFGILGAIVGSLVGNSITDGLAGVFEGYEWQRLSKSKIRDTRTILSVAVGKLVGCLLGGGAVLTIAWTLFGLT